jgi:hypothetical protein
VSEPDDLHRRGLGVEADYPRGGSDRIRSGGFAVRGSGHGHPVQRQRSDYSICLDAARLAGRRQRDTRDDEIVDGQRGGCEDRVVSVLVFLIVVTELP